MATPAALMERVRALTGVLYREMIKFGVVGAVAFVVDLGGFNLLIHSVLQDKVTTARILSGVVATTVAWIGNRSWTFRHRRGREAKREVVLFFVVNGVALGISTVVLVISHYVLDYTSTTADNVATVIGIGLGTLFRFYTYRKVVFPNEPIGEDVDSRAG